MPGLETLLSLGTDISQLATGLNQSKELLSSFANTIKGVMDTIVHTVQGAINWLVKLGMQIKQLGQESAKFDSMRDSYNKMAAEFGATGQQLLSAMNVATQGMAKDSELISNSMTAMMLISKEAMGDVTKTIPMFAKIATAASRALGTSVEYMFGSIARGVGRASPKILDNLGMIIKLTDVYDTYAKKLGITRKELSTVEKQTALVNEVLRQGDSYVENLGISTGGLATVQKQLATNMANFRDVVGQAVMPMVQALQGLYSNLANTVIERVIPAFRTLGRVLSEVTDMANPFERWISGSEGDKPTDRTIARIDALKQGLAQLQEDGADYLGEVTDANERFEEAVLELENDKFGPRLAKIQNDLLDRIANIWEDYNRNKTRKAEDENKDDVRRVEAHKEKLVEIEKRYDDQMSDAIRNRDARTLLNLMRQQGKEKSQAETQFQDEQKKRDEDREIERRRALEDAQLRESQAKDSAAKQWASVVAEAEKATAALAEIRDKEINAAQKGYEAELKAYEDKLQEQNELIIQQVMEENKIRSEMSKPLPPIWEKVSAVLTVVWDKLQKIAAAITSIIENPSIMNIADQLGFDPETVDNFRQTLLDFNQWLDGAKEKSGGMWDAFLEKLPEIKEALLDLKEKAKDLWEAFMNIAGPEFVLMWEDLKLAFEEIRPYWPEIVELAKLLAGVLAGALILGLIVVVASLRSLSSLLIDVSLAFGRLADGITDAWEGIKKMWSGGFKIFKGLVTGDLDLLKEGWVERWEGFVEFLGGIWESIEAVVEGAFTGIIQSAGAFFKSFIDIFERLAYSLVGGSIIPDMFDDIISVLGSFFINATQKWTDGWNGFITVVQTVWTTISEVISGFTTSIGSTVGSWWSGITSKVEEASEPARTHTGNTGYNAWGGQQVSADNWNIYADGKDSGAASQVYDVLVDVVTTPTLMDRWRRR